MKATPFKPDRHLPPIPFSEELCRKAREIKEKGLEWEPHVGCFVWDPEGTIPAPSPLGDRIYFILNLNRFLQFYENIEIMKKKLVWLPTWHQARQILAPAGKSKSEQGARTNEQAEEHSLSNDSELDYIRLYDRVITHMSSK